MTQSGIIVLLALASGLYYAFSYAKLWDEKHKIEKDLKMQADWHKNIMWRIRFAYLHKSTGAPFHFEEDALSAADKLLGDYEPYQRLLATYTDELKQNREKAS
jgi:hypothetical protein